MDTKGGNPWGGGGGGINWAIGIDMYTLMCIKLTTNKNLLYKKNRENLFIRFIAMCAIKKKNTTFTLKEKKKTIYFPVSTALVISKFWYVIFLSSFSSNYFLTPIVIFFGGVT